MLDHFHLPTPHGNAEVFYFECAAGAIAESYARAWTKPRGKSMAHIILVGAGGSGGNGAVGANSAAAGGGGGGSGAQTTLLAPLHFLPDVLWIALSYTQDSRILIEPAFVANSCLARAANGGNGGNASGGTGGTAGAVGAAAVVGDMPLGWNFRQSVLAGQAGTAGSGASVGVTLTLPTTGLLVTGGTGGGGLGTAGSGGEGGGAITGAGVFPGYSHTTQNTPTLPAFNGHNGLRPVPGLLYGYGGTGGGATHGTATGGGLVGARGGNGAPGCGGGGGGGALTGSTQGLGGLGGPAFCVITCW